MNIISGNPNYIVEAIKTIEGAKYDSIRKMRNSYSYKLGKIILRPIRIVKNQGTILYYNKKIFENSLYNIVKNVITDTNNFFNNLQTSFTKLKNKFNIFKQSGF
jgi:hypothetical protein